MRVWLQIQESRVRSLPGPILSWRLIMNLFLWSSPPFRWFIQEGLLPVTSESMCRKFWLTACSCLPRKKVCFGGLTVPHDHSCWLGRKAPKQTNKQTQKYSKTLITGHLCSMLIIFYMFEIRQMHKKHKNSSMAVATCCSKHVSCN